MWYAVVVDRHPVTPAATEPVLPEVVAHNLSLEDTRKLEAELNPATFEGQTLGLIAQVVGYHTRHAAADLGTCIECAEIVHEYCRRMLRLGEQEAAKRGLGILKRNMRNEISGENPDGSDE